MNQRYLLEKTIGVNLDGHFRKKKIVWILFHTLLIVAVAAMLSIVFRACARELDKPMPVVEAAVFEPQHSDPNYFAWKMQNDPQFRKEVEEADREEVARLKL